MPSAADRESAARYGVSFNDLMRHLWVARRTNTRLLARCVVYVDDLVHAIACARNVPLAWSDLADRYERALIRRCRPGHDEISATIVVRRLFADLRRRNLKPPDIKRPSLHCYAGTRALRAWLADRLQAIQMQELVAASDSMTRRPIAMSACGGGAAGSGHWQRVGQPTLRLASAPAGGELVSENDSPQS